MVHQQPCGMEPSREQQAVGLQYRSNIYPGDQAREGSPRVALKWNPNAGCGAQLGLLRAIKAH